MTLGKAKQLRKLIESLAVTLDDTTALTGIELFPKWQSSKAYSVGDRVQYNSTLYRCVQAHTSQNDWTPDAVPALYTVIDVAHTGTQDDPIPAERGMEYVYGLYYTDSEDGKLYLCQRTGEAAGGTVVLQYMPHELVGHYFVEVT